MAETQTYYSDPQLHRLRDKQIKDVYKDLLQVSTGNNTGIDSALVAISDGEATASKLELSWLEANVATGCQIDKTAVTATSAQINVMGGWRTTFPLQGVAEVIAGKEDAFGSQNNKIAMGADIGITWNTATSALNKMGLGTTSKLNTGGSANNVLKWRATDYFNNDIVHEGNWVGFVATPVTDGSIQTVSASKFRDQIGFGSEGFGNFGNIILNDKFHHNGLFTGSSEVGYTIPASISTDGYLYYYHRTAGTNINEYRLVFVIQDGANSYTSVEIIAKNISGSGGQPPPA